MLNIPIFFKTIFKNVSVATAIRIEIEDDVGFFVRYIPGILGYILRYIVYKVFLRKIDSMPYISTNVKIMHMNKVSLGSNVLINSNTYIYGKGGIDIGNNVLISPNCCIVAGNHRLDPTIPIIEQPSDDLGILIGNDCWIGANVVVTAGVKIAEGSVIGAGSVVVYDTEPYSINAGVPAKKIGTRTTRSS